MYFPAHLVLLLSRALFIRGELVQSKRKSETTCRPYQTFQLFMKQPQFKLPLYDLHRTHMAVSIQFYYCPSLGWTADTDSWYCLWQSAEDDAWGQKRLCGVVIAAHTSRRQQNNWLVMWDWSSILFPLLVPSSAACCMQTILWFVVFYFGLWVSCVLSLSIPSYLSHISLLAPPCSQRASTCTSSVRFVLRPVVSALFHTRLTTRSHEKVNLLLFLFFLTETLWKTYMQSFTRTLQYLCEAC